MEFRQANNEDDGAIRQLLQQMPLNGMLRIRYLREPSFLNSLKIQGTPEQTVVGITGNKIMAVGSRNLQKLHIQGELKTAGYISNLRYHPDTRHGISLLKGIKHMEDLPSPEPVDFHYATLIDNDLFTKSILASNRPRMPRFFDMGIVNTFSIPLKKYKTGRKTLYGKNIVQVNEVLMPDVLSFLREEGKLRNFFPLTEPGIYAAELLQPSSFFAAFENGKICGVCSVMDLKDYKQYILEDYSKSFGILRTFLNGWYQLKKQHAIPARGKPVHLMYIGFPVVKNDDPEIFRELLNYVYDTMSGGMYHYLSVALHEKNPLTTCLQHFPKIKYTSRLYLVKLNHDTFTVDPEALKNSIPFIDFPRL